MVVPALDVSDYLAVAAMLLVTLAVMFGVRVAMRLVADDGGGRGSRSSWPGGISPHEEDRWVEEMTGSTDLTRREWDAAPPPEDDRLWRCDSCGQSWPEDFTTCNVCGSPGS